MIGIGCLGLIIITIIGVFIFFIAIGSTNDSEEMIDDVEYVNLLIDGGCKTGEVLIEDEQVCSIIIDCQNSTDCAQWGDNVVQQLEANYGSLVLEEAVATDSKDEVLAQYDVNLEYDTLEAYGNVNDETLLYHSSLWNSFAWLIPEEARLDMTKFEVFDSGTLLAYVQTNDNNAEEWTLGMNRKNIELASERMVTYIHEFAHLLSLRNTEIDYFANEQSCEGNYIEDYCYLEDAYINYFYQFFYKDAQEASYEYFVSDYAMSSIVEDFAESFAHFVLTPYPTGNTIADEKIRFFYHFDNLIILRAQILGRAATWLDRTVLYVR